MRAILLTGTAGFIGSNFVPYFLEKYPEYKLINLDLLTYAGDLDNLKECEANLRYKFIQGNICDRPLVESLFKTYDIQGVIHFAAESHVDNSIKNPEIFIHTNVNGTFVLIDVATKYWMEKPFVFKSGYEECRFHHISTDEVYGSLGESGLFTENTPYAPSSPYSASKASSDMLVRSYHHTYGMNTLITNCSNNYGPKQHNEKLIPTIIRKALEGEEIPIYGDGKNIRDWLFVHDHCSGIDIAYHNGKPGDTYNIGGHNEYSNNQIAQRICTLLDQIHPRSDDKSYKEQISYVEDRAGHDKRYAIDATKIETELGWHARENFDTGIIKTVQWYINKKNYNNQMKGGLRAKGQIKTSNLDKPLITIITAVYNGEKHLEETIQNIINQTYDNFEYIIIDGGSTDGTLDIIRKYEDKIDYWVSEKDKGISDAFNKGVKLAHGTYINFQGDGDGFYNSQVLSNIIEDIDPENDMLISGGIQRISPEGKELFVSKHVQHFDKKSLLFRMSLPHQGLFTHKNMFKQYGLFDINNTFCMDYEHLLRAYKYFPNVVMKDIIVAKWRADGLGNGRILEILAEYDKIKRDNEIASNFILSIVNFWTLLKYIIKTRVKKS